MESVCPPPPSGPPEQDPECTLLPSPVCPSVQKQLPPASSPASSGKTLRDPTSPDVRGTSATVCLSWRPQPPRRQLRAAQSRAVRCLLSARRSTASAPSGVITPHFCKQGGPAQRDRDMRESHNLPLPFDAKAAPRLSSGRNRTRARRRGGTCRRLHAARLLGPRFPHL